MKKIYVFLLSLIMYSAFAQDGSLDVSYNPQTYAGWDIVIDNNDNIYTHPGSTLSYISKITPAGNTSNFGPPLWNVWKLYAESNGGILVLGFVSGYPDQTYLKRILPNGTEDTLFAPNIPFGFKGYSMTKLPDGRILIGSFDSYYNVPNILCINETDGAINPFNNGLIGISGSSIQEVLDLKVDGNGDIVAGGHFFSYNNTPRRSILKLNPDGSLNSFNFTGIDGGFIKTIAIQNDNSIIIGGEFTHTPSGRKNLLKISPTGILDPNFINITDTNFNSIEKILIQDTGKIVIMGNFHSIAGYSRKHIARLNPGGTSLDLCFDAGTGPLYEGQPGVIYRGVLDTNQNIFITGSFDTFSGYTRKAIAKLKGKSVNNLIANNDTFNVIQNGSPNSTNVLNNDYLNGVKPTVSDVNITTSTPNPIATGINFSTATGTITVSTNALPGTYTFSYTLCPKTGCGDCKTAKVTIKVTGSIDAVDDTKTVNYGTALTFNVLDNDKLNGVIIPSGTMTVKYLSMPITYITAHKNGTITIPAGTPAGTYYLTYEICILGLPIVCDIATITFTVIGNIVAQNDNFTTNCINGITGGTSDDVTLNDTMDGTPINDDIINISIINNGGIPNLTVNAFGILSIPANTAFGTYTITYRICQKNTLSCTTATAKICVNDGFDPGTGANGPIYAVALQDNGKIIIGGNFTEYDGIPRKRIARLNNDLSLDLSFDPQGIGFNDIVYALTLQGDNILVGGLFTATGTGVLKNHLVRLNSDGIVDNTFVNNNFQYVGISPTPAFYIKAITLDNSGRILVGGSFGNVNSFSGTLKTKIIRLSANGNPDNTFKSILSTDSGAVHNITVLDDQTIVIGGINLKIPSKNVILYKVTSAGDLDLNFIVGQAVDVQTGLMNVTDIAKNNGKLVVVGYFNSYNNSGLSNIVQINPNGVLDGLSVFNPGISSNSVINSVAVDPSNNNLIIGGNFSSFNGNSASKIARLTVNGTFDPSFNIGIGFDPGANNSYSIFDIKLQDSKIVAGGHFTKFNGIDAKYITRLVQNSPVIQGRMNMYPEEKATKGISIYPNPSEGIFNIDFKGYDENKFDITIYNALGQLIHKASVTPQNTNQIDLTSFGAGSYFITLQNANETINKIVVKK